MRPNVLSHLTHPDEIEAFGIYRLWEERQDEHLA